jgi:hypothetical protein
MKTTINVVKVLPNATSNSRTLSCTLHTYDQHITGIEDLPVFYFKDYFAIIDDSHSNLFCLNSLQTPVFFESDCISPAYEFFHNGQQLEKLNTTDVHIVSQSPNETYTLNTLGLHQVLAKYSNAKYSTLQTPNELFVMLHEFSISKYSIETYYYYMNSKHNIHSFLKFKNNFALELAWIKPDHLTNSIYKPYYFNEYDTNEIRFVTDLYLSNVLPTRSKLLLPYLPHGTHLALYARISHGYAHIKNCVLKDGVYSLLEESCTEYEPCCNKLPEACTCWKMIQQPKFTPYTVLNAHTDRKYVGFELEVDFLEDKGCDYSDEEIDFAIATGLARTRIDQTIFHLTNREMYLKYEGSVDSGFEIVSIPMKPEVYLLERYKKLFTALSEANMFAGKKSYFSSGLHFHFSKAWFTNKDHAERVNAELTKIYQNGELCEIANRTTKALIEYSKPTSRILNEEEDREVAMSERANTYEFRFFASTINYDRFTLCMAFILFLIDNTKESPIDYYSKEYIEFRYKLKRTY